MTRLVSWAPIKALTLLRMPHAVDAESPPGLCGLAPGPWALRRRELGGGGPKAALTLGLRPQSEGLTLPLSWLRRLREVTRSFWPSAASPRKERRRRHLDFRQLVGLELFWCEEVIVSS